MNLDHLLVQSAADSAVWKPDIFDLSRDIDASRCEYLMKTGAIRHVRDAFEEQLRELFAIQHPPLAFTGHFEDDFEQYRRARLAEFGSSSRDGRWVYFPWNSTLTHVLVEDEFFIVRTARNRNLITEEEQKKFYDARIGIAGLSVGNSVALAIALQGGARFMRLADFDTLALTNTNRIRTSTASLGLPKTTVTARQIYEINPYAIIEVIPEGLTETSIDRFFEGPPSLDIVIDEIDSLAYKCLIRERAKKHRLPVVMAADNGDNGLVDIERYDESMDLPFFHGRMGDVSFEYLRNLDKISTGKLIMAHIGPEVLDERARLSTLEVGSTLVSWPQLGGAALVNGSAVAYAVRQIANRQQLPAKRALIVIDKPFLSFSS